VRPPFNGIQNLVIQPLAPGAVFSIQRGSLIEVVMENNFTFETDWVAGAGMIILRRVGLPGSAFPRLGVIASIPIH